MKTPEKKTIKTIADVLGPKEDEYDDDTTRAWSAKELALIMGCSTGQVHVKLRPGLESGEFEKKKRHAKPRDIPVYRLKLK